MNSDGWRRRRGLALAGTGMALVMAGCSRQEVAQNAPSPVAEPTQIMEDVGLFGASGPATQADAPLSAPAASRWPDPKDTPLQPASPPTARPLSDL